MTFIPHVIDGQESESASGARFASVDPWTREPYAEVAARVIAAIGDARTVADGHEAVLVSHQLPIWIIRLAPRERIGFHRHVLNYFWTSVNGGRGRQHLMDGSTVEYTYQPGETRHETYGPGEYKVHDLENIGDKELVFMTVEFLTSANKPLPIPQAVRSAAA